MTHLSVALPPHPGSAESVASPAWALRAADSIGRRLTSTAVWSGDECTWLVAPARPASDHAEYAPAPAGLYRGVAGIALFLMELHAITGDRDALRCASAALRYVVAHLDPAEPPFAAGTGPAGVAFVLARAASLTGDPLWEREARRVLQPLFGREREDKYLDFVGGVAGAIPMLLAIGRWLGWDAASASAVEAGAHLLETATRRPTGWSWRTLGGYACARDLTGLAHGASGVGLAALQLYTTTDDAVFRVAAEQAFAYEDAHYDAERRNWPDYRFLNEPRDPSPARIDGPSARRRPAASSAFESQTLWCHGAGGMALARAFGAVTLGHGRYRELAMAAASTTAETMDRYTNYSLCHGVCGNAEIVRTVGELLDEPALSEQATHRLRRAAEELEGTGTPWPSGGIASRPDASLFLGDAGIGHVLLRVHAPAIPSALLFGLMRPTPRMATTACDDSAIVAHRYQHIQTFFGLTLAACDAFGHALPAVRAALRTGATLDDLRRVQAALRQAAERDTSGFLADALRLDEALLEAELASTEWAAERMMLDARANGDGLRTARFWLAPSARLITQRFDWRSWVDAGARCEPPSPGPVHFVVFGDAGRGAFEILSASESDLIARLGSEVSRAMSAEDLAALTGASRGVEGILDLLRRGYVGGFVDADV